jgi:hypothetical protein
MESEEFAMTDPDQSPAEALEAIRRSRDVVREAVRDPRGATRYTLIYSTLAAIAVGGQILPTPLNVLCSSGAAIGLALLYRGWTERTGVQISGVSPKRARWVAWGLGAVLIALMLVAIWAGWNHHLWIGLPLVAVAFVAAWIGSQLWTKVFLAETADR